MKFRLTSIVLLLLLVSPPAIMYAWLSIQKKQVKSEIKWNLISKVDKSDLVLLHFSKEDVETQLRWKHAKEFEYQGEMYDVVERKVSADSLSFYCWWDHEETKLNKQLAGLLDTFYPKNPEKKNNERRLLSFYHSQYFSQNALSKFSIPAHQIDQNGQYANRYKARHICPDAPPPQSIV